jgi:transcriptional regulator with XRE-family HTH domain
MSLPATTPPERAATSSVLGANVYRLRVLRVPRIAQETVAERAGIAQETVRQIEQSRDPAKPQLNPRLDTIEKLAEALEVDPADLLTRTPSKPTGQRRRRTHTVPLTVVPGSGGDRPRALQRQVT